MPHDISADEQAIIAEILSRRGANGRPTVPSQKVKRFRQLIGEEIERTGELRKESVDRLLHQLRSGEL